MSTIPDDLKEIYKQCTEFIAHPGEPSDKPIEWCVSLIERIGRAEAENAELKEKITRLSTPLKSSEYFDACWIGNTNPPVDVFNRVIAARAGGQ